MPAIDHLLGSPAARRLVWKLWYPFLTRKLRRDDVTYLNYAFETDPPMAIALAPEDERDRPCVQLYHHVASRIDLENLDVLEVSCGHGGGAAYITRCFRPHRYLAVDLNPEGIRFCQHRHHMPRLEFLRADAEALPLVGSSFDAVINVEASHCYSGFEHFLAEVHRVLKPGGHFLYADFRFRNGVLPWERALRECSLECRVEEDISQCVLRGLRMNSKRSQALIEKHLPSFLHGPGRDFAGVVGSRIYNALADGEVTYRSYHMWKSEAA